MTDVNRAKNSSSKLPELEQLIKTLRFPPMASPIVSDGQKLDIACGTCLFWTILDQPEIKVSRFFQSAGSNLPEHIHQQKEFLIVYAGSMFLKLRDAEEIKIPAGDSVIIDIGNPHSKRFLEDSWYLAITIPKTQDW